MLPAEFANACHAQARAIRRLPAALRRELGAAVLEDVARPLAGRIAADAGGPYRRPLSAAVKARKAADPQIVIGGSRRVVSGGASARQLVYGVEFGGGSRTTVVGSTPRARGHRRHSTRQFIRNRHPFIFDTIRDAMPAVLDAWAEAVIRITDKEVPRNGR